MGEHVSVGRLKRKGQRRMSEREKHEWVRFLWFACKRRRETVALGGRKVQRPACRNYSQERGWQLTARGLFITSTLHRARLSQSSVFVASHHDVGSSGRRLRGCDSGVSVGPVWLPSGARC